MQSHDLKSAMSLLYRCSVALVMVQLDQSSPYAIADAMHTLLAREMRPRDATRDCSRANATLSGIKRMGLMTKSMIARDSCLKHEELQKSVSDVLHCFHCLSRVCPLSR